MPADAPSERKPVERVQILRRPSMCDLDATDLLCEEPLERGVARSGWPFPTDDMTLSATITSRLPSPGAVRTERVGVATLIHIPGGGRAVSSIGAAITYDRRGSRFASTDPSTPIGTRVATTTFPARSFPESVTTRVGDPRTMSVTRVRSSTVPPASTNAVASAWRYFRGWS